MQSFLVLALAACSGPDDNVLTGIDRPSGDSGSNPVTLTDQPDTGLTNQAPRPNQQTDGDNERCLLLFGGTDRMISDDVGLPFGTSPRTMQAWVRTNWDGEQVAVAYGRGSVLQGYTMGVVDGVPFVDTNGTARVRGDTRIDDDEWHHLAAAWDGNTVVLLVDGATDVVSTLTGNTLSGGIAVGNRPEASPERDPWVGWIDDVRIYSVARDPASIFADRDGPDDDTLLAWYDFEVEGDVEGANVLVEDLSGEGHTGETAGADDRPKFPFCR